jgi:hypothetical protein
MAYVNHISFVSACVMAERQKFHMLEKEQFKVDVGDSVTFNCAYAAITEKDPPASIEVTWYRPPYMLADVRADEIWNADSAGKNASPSAEYGPRLSASPVASLSSGHSLTLADFNERDVGNYYCVIFLHYGEEKVKLLRFFDVYLQDEDNRVAN